MADYGFHSRYKLIKTDEFSSVFSFRQRIFGDKLALHYMPNGLEYPRLGIVVSKKTARRSVARNYMRRVVREWFRKHRESMAGVDMIIRANKPFGRTDFEGVMQELEHLSGKMQQRISRLQDKRDGAPADLAG